MGDRKATVIPITQLDNSTKSESCQVSSKIDNNPELIKNIDHWSLITWWRMIIVKSRSERWGKGLKARQFQPKDVWQSITIDGWWWSIYNPTMVGSLIEPCRSPRLDTVSRLKQNWPKDNNYVVDRNWHILTRFLCYNASFKSSLASKCLTILKADVQ